MYAVSRQCRKKDKSVTLEIIEPIPKNGFTDTYLTDRKLENLEYDTFLSEGHRWFQRKIG